MKILAGQAGLPIDKTGVLGYTISQIIKE